MREYLDFLKENEVNTTLDRTEFLNKANLTDCEREYLNNHLGFIDLTHIVKFSDKSEILIFHTDYKNWDGKYTEHELAKKIAATLPYQCIIAIQNGNVVTFWVCDRKENSRNNRRSVIEGLYHSPSFVCDIKYPVAQKVRSALYRALVFARNSGEAIASLRYSFVEEFGSSKY